MNILGGAHWALEHWYVTLQPKLVTSEPNGPKIQFDTKCCEPLKKSLDIQKKIHFDECCKNT